MRSLICCCTLLSALFLAQCRSPEENPVPFPAHVTETPTPEIGVAFATLALPTVAVIQTTPTPLPSPIPTATPTPILYTIEAGDTLLGIAINRHTTVDEIQLLNPDVQPELLQIGQVIQLPPPATAVAQLAASTPVPLQITVRQISAYQTPVGSLWLLGEVVNEGSVAAESVQVTIELMDETANPVGTAVAWVAASVIPPGETAPFGVLVNEPPVTFDHPVVSISGGESVVDFGTRYLDLAVVNSVVMTEAEQLQISGQVQNVGEATAEQVTVVATLYDQQGNVSGYQKHTLPGALAAGESAPFTLDVAPPGGRTVKVGWVAQGWRQAAD